MELCARVIIFLIFKRNKNDSKEDVLKLNTCMSNVFIKYVWHMLLFALTFVYSKNGVLPFFQLLHATAKIQ